MSYLEHEWGPDRDRPGFARCLWCGLPFADAGGTLCPTDPQVRAAASATTLELNPPPEPRPARPWTLAIAAALAVIVVIACGTALGWVFIQADAATRP